MNFIHKPFLVRYLLKHTFKRPHAFILLSGKKKNYTDRLISFMHYV